MGSGGVASLTLRGACGVNPPLRRLAPTETWGFDDAASRHHGTASPRRPPEDRLY